MSLYIKDRLKIENEIHPGLNFELPNIGIEF